MKALMILLGLSLAANTAFLFVLLGKPVTTPATLTPVKADPINSRTSESGHFSMAQLSALNSGNLSELTAANLPEEIARNLLIGRAYARLQARTREMLRTNRPANEYWKNSANQYFALNSSKETRAELSRAQREYAEALRTATGDDSPFDTRFDYLSADKKAQLRRIDQDYGEIKMDLYNEMGGISFSSDQEKLRLLKQEQERDIASTLSPQELEQYNLRSSQTAQNIRSRFGDAIKTEDEYLKLYALQKAFDDQYADPTGGGSQPMSKEFATARMAAEGKLQDDFRAALSPENFTAIQHAMDQEYQALTLIAKRLDLPASTTEAVITSRDTYAEQSQQINKNPALSDQDRRTELKNLAEKAQAELRSTLGTEAAEVYIQRANWISMLKSGSAFSTNEKDAPNGNRFYGMSVYPVQPARKANPPKG